MARKSKAEDQRFRWYEDDRSGFQFGFQPLTSRPNAYSRESGKPIPQAGLEVSPLSYDTPPPSKKSLGGEGDISGEPRTDSNPLPPSDVYVIPPESVKVIVNVNSSSSIQWNTEPVIYAYSTVNLTMAVNPQIAFGTQGQQIAMECVGSSITLRNGSGITVDFNKSVVRLNSGDIAVLLMNATDNTWHLTSTSQSGGLF